MKALLLAGGKGKRLAPFTNFIPKPMLLINDKPFLEILLDQLANFGFQDIVISLSHHPYIVQGYFGNKYNGLNIDYSIDDNAGTAGAIVKASNFFDENEDIFILNADCLTNINFGEFYKFHKKLDSDLTIAAIFMKNTERFGVINTDIDHKIINFLEKAKNISPNYINSGIYLAKPKIFNIIKTLPYSFEQKFIINYIKKNIAYCYKFEGYFIDIGIEEDFERASYEIPEKFRHLFYETSAKNCAN